MAARCMQALVLVLAASAAAQAGKAYQHGWDTVGEVMAMHGKFHDPNQTFTTAEIEYLARTYRLITTGSTCQKGMVKTLEDAVLAAARRLKAANPAVKIGMYYRSDFALELAECSSYAPEWNAHPEWHLKDDAGKPIMRDNDQYYIDYSNPGAANFFARALTNVTTYLLPSGDPILDFVYIDGCPPEDRQTEFQHGIGPARSKLLYRDIYRTFATIQATLDGNGHGQGVILNTMDTAFDAASHVATGATGAMFDHWSILQFIDRKTGAFNATLMDQAFQLVNSSLVANITVEVKGWPGPIARQKDVYPPALVQPKTVADFQRVSGERFNSELALFLLVATSTDFWTYSWFWGWDDYVPNKPDSTVPPGGFPESKCDLGAPRGPGVRVPGTWTYRREFEFASVFVDLGNRTASHVTFHHPC